jgi:hypothetical protein
MACLLVCSCASTSDALREGAGQHVYVQPLVELWPQVQALMTEQGYVWRGNPGQYALRTEWRENGTSGANRTLVSYLIQGEPHPSGGSTLRVSRGLKAEPNDANSKFNPNQMAPSGAFNTHEVRSRLADDEVAWQSQRAMYAPSRDLDMELLLMRKLDPAAVTKLEGQATAAAK